MRIKLNSNSGWKLWCGPLILGFIMSLIILPVPFGYCDDVDLETARLVAENTLQRHVALYGDWNGASTPTVLSGRAVSYNGTAVAYNFQIAPGGHVLVAAENALSPVLLYSTSSSFVPERAQQPNAIEGWILPELKEQIETVKAFSLSGASRSITLSSTDASRRIADAWTTYTMDGAAGTLRSVAGSSVDSSADLRTGSVRTASIGPLLTTTWGQSDPYNDGAPSIAVPYPQYPLNESCSHALTGCVATAWAQLLRYWSWPIQGTGSHSYTWYDIDGGAHTQSANFNTTYNWYQMLNDYGSGSTSDQRAAVAELMYHMGVAAEMEYGCNGSGSGAYADEVLDVYFYYQSTMNQYSRSSYSADAWFALIKAELDADPARPVVFSIFGPGGGHEVIIDGYQTAPDSVTDMVHINYGWTGFYDGYYNITVDFSAGGYTWWGSYQDIVTGIEPDNDPPLVDAGSYQTFDEETLVQLIGSATDLDSVGISSYLWTQVSGPTVTLSDTSITNPTFTPPNVHSETIFVFQLRAEDTNRAHAEDTCTITVSNTDGSLPPAANAGSDQTVDEETVVDLSGSATDPNSAGISRYLWTQLSGPTVTLSNATSTDASFTAPNVDTTTTMTFRFRADYDDGDSATDTCTITVSNTDGSTAPVQPPPTYSSNSGGGGGGCFISLLP